MPSYAWDTQTLKVNITTVSLTLTAYNLHSGQPGLDDVTVTIYFSVKHMKYILCKIYKLLCSLQIAYVCKVFLLYICGSQSVLHTICNGYFEVNYFLII